MRTAGRRAERDKIARVSAAVHESSVVFTGDVGIGKSHLLEAAQAESTIDAVLLRINPVEAGWPLSGFSAILSSINDSRAIEFGGRFVLRSTDAEHMFAAARDLLILIRGLTLPPMLLLVDDVDLMDPESQLLVGFIAGRLGGTGIRFIATARRFDPSGPFGGVPHETLGPLGAAEALELATQVTRSPADAGTLAIVAAQSDGNPRALLEILAELGPDQLSGDLPLNLPAMPGPTARAVAAHAIENLGRTQRAMLDRLSTAPLSLRSVATAGGIHDEDALHDLVFAGLLEARGTFVSVRSALLRSQLYWSMSGKGRREHHAAAAEAYRGHDELLAGWHRALSEGDTDTTRATMNAAVLFARDGHIGAAVEFAEHARRRAAGTPDLLAALSDLADALFLRGELPLAARYVEVGLGTMGTSVVALELAVLRLKIEFMRTQRIPDLDLEAWVSVYSSGHPRLAAELLALASLCFALRWEVKQARALLEQARALLPVVSRAAAHFQDRTLGLIEATDGSGAPVVPQNPLRPQRSPNRRVADLIIDGKTASLLEDYSGARRLFAIVLGQRPTPEPIWMESARYLLADNEIRAGHFTSARTAILEWRSSRSARSYLPTHTYLDAWLAYAEGLTGDAHELLAERLAQHPHEDNPGVAASLLALKGELSLIDGDPEEAARLLSLAETVGAQFGNPALVRHHADYIEASIAAGRRPQAAVVLEEFERRAQRHRSRWADLALSRARALLADDEHAPRMFAEAITACGPSDSALDIGRLHLAQARKLEALGAAAEAHAALTSARSVLDGAGAIAWVAHIDTRLGTGAHTARSTLLHHLSDEELQVVHLVQQGLRNKEIASRLYLSVRTVELRLTHIYRKVGARSRSHLISLMS